jgi:hypothetical protein
MEAFLFLCSAAILCLFCLVSVSPSFQHDPLISHPRKIDNLSSCGTHEHSVQLVGANLMISRVITDNMVDFGQCTQQSIPSALQLNPCTSWKERATDIYCS